MSVNLVNVGTGATIITENGNQYVVVPSDTVDPKFLETIPMFHTVVYGLNVPECDSYCAWYVTGKAVGVTNFLSNNGSQLDLSNFNAFSWLMKDDMKDDMKDEKVENKPHKHAEIIKKWADGVPIQFKDMSTNEEWIEPYTTDKTPPFDNPCYEFRVKPKIQIKYGYIIIYTNGEIGIDQESDYPTIKSNIRLVFEDGILVRSEVLKVG